MAECSVVACQDMTRVADTYASARGDLSGNICLHCSSCSFLLLMETSFPGTLAATHTAECHGITYKMGLYCSTKQKDGYALSLTIGQYDQSVC